MKNKIWIIVAVVFVAIMVLAAVIYPKLAEKYADENSVTPPNENTIEGSVKIDTVKQTDDFIVYDMDGNAVKLSDFFGKPIVVNFWATWCGPCRSELPAFNHAYQQYKDDVVFLMVNLTDGNRDTKSSVAKFMESSGFSFPVYLDMEYNASDTYGIYSIPETLFIKADGTLYDTRIGAMSETTLTDYIEKMIGES